MSEWRRDELTTLINSRYSQKQVISGTVSTRTLSGAKLPRVAPHQLNVQANREKERSSSSAGKAVQCDY